MERLAGRAGRALLGICFFVVFCITATVLSGCVNRYTVSFDANGGVSAPAPIENIANGSKIGAPIFSLERDNYTFDGKWYKEKGCAEEWRFDADAVNGNLTLYAGWIPSAPGNESDENDDSGNDKDNSGSETGGDEDNSENETGSGENNNGNGNSNGENNGGNETGGGENNSGNETGGGENNNGNENSGGTDGLALLKAGLIEELALFETECAVEGLGESYAAALSEIAAAGALNINSAPDTVAAQERFEAARAEMLRALKSHTAAVVEEYFTDALREYEPDSAQAELLEEHCADILREIESAISIESIKKKYEEYLLLISALECDMTAAGYIAELNEIVRILALDWWNIDVGDISGYTENIRNAATTEAAAEHFASVCAYIDSKADGGFLIYISIYYDGLLFDKISSLTEIDFSKTDKIWAVYYKISEGLYSAPSFSERKNIYLAAAAEMESCLTE